MSSPRVVAKITTLEQVKELEKILGVDFPTETERKSTRQTTEEDLIGGNITETQLLNYGEESCNKQSAEMVYGIETNHKRVTDSYYDYFEWQELFIDPPNEPTVFKTECLRDDDVSGYSGIAQNFMDKCEPATQSGGTPCEGPGMTEYIPYSEDKAAQFQTIFGRCRGHYSEDVNKVRRMFGLRDCSPQC